MNQRFIKLVSSITRMLGYELIPQWRMLEYDLSRYLGKFFEHYNIQAVIDVGANNGGYHDFLRQQVGYQGDIYSFEPVQENIDIIKEKSKSDPHWHVFGFALGSEPSFRVIKVMKSNDFSSFLQPKHDVIDDYTKYNIVEKEETVEIRTLDSVYVELKKKHGLEQFYLKMDTQGFDIEVFRGAKNTLCQVVALQSEVSVKQIYEDNIDYQQSIEQYSNAGFELSGLFPVNRDKYLRVVEFDCLMINQKYLATTKTV